MLKYRQKELLEYCVSKLTAMRYSLHLEDKNKYPLSLHWFIYTYISLFEKTTPVLKLGLFW